MSIQYQGSTIINATMNSAAGTRAELAQWVRDQLILAGWSSSGSATDYQVTSATTPQSLACRVRCYDPGSGNCALFKMSNTGGTKTQAGTLFLLPAAAKVWRIIANKYQFFVFTPGVSAAREFMCGGVPWVPSWGGATEAIWGVNNSESDTSVTVRKTFRTLLHGSSGAATPGNQVGIFNGTIAEANNSGAILSSGAIQLFPVVAMGSVAADSASSVAGYRWSDGSVITCDAVLGWGLASTLLTSAEPKAAGQIWDAAVFLGAWTNDTTITYDGRSYYPITLSNAVADSDQSGSLFVAVT